MKRDAAYYEEQGREYARAGIDLKQDSPGAWQAKAIRRGYEAEVARLAEFKHGVEQPGIVGEALDRVELQTVAKPVKVSATGNAVAAHIDHLLDMLRAESNPKRRERLAAKANKLSLKWFGEELAGHA